MAGQKGREVLDIEGALEARREEAAEGPDEGREEGDGGHVELDGAEGQPRGPAGGQVAGVERTENGVGLASEPRVELKLHRG